LPGLSGWRVIEELQTNKALGETPLLVYTARDLTRKEEVKLGKAAKKHSRFCASAISTAWSSTSACRT